MAVKNMLVQTQYIILIHAQHIACLIIPAAVKNVLLIPVQNTHQKSAQADVLLTVDIVVRLIVMMSIIAILYRFVHY
jgi:hypothetical protein